MLASLAVRRIIARHIAISFKQEGLIFNNAFFINGDSANVIPILSPLLSKLYVFSS